MHVYTSLTSAEAVAIAGKAVSIAGDDEGKPIAVCVLDVRGVQLAAACMDGATEANVRTAYAKARAVLDFQRDTRDFRFNPDGSAKEAGWPDHNVVNALAVNPAFSSFSGGVAVRLSWRTGNGPIVGAIAVSGRSELDDHQVAEQAIAALDD